MAPSPFNVHLVDGTYELFRMYYGAPEASTPEGTEVGATRALARSMLALLRGGATHVACAFDHVVESFRNDLFEGYKTGEGIDPELARQFPLAERAAAALGLVVWPMVEFEADDALATAAARWQDHSDVEQVVICSPDKDLAQCVRGDRVVLFDRRRDRTTDEDGVLARFGVRPHSIADYLALVGDDADGVPGIPRWGARSSATLLHAYDHIEQIPHDPQDWTVDVRGARALATILSERRQEALLFRRLTTLRTDVPLVESIDDLRWRGARRAEMTELSQDLDDMGLMQLVHRWDKGT